MKKDIIGGKLPAVGGRDIPPMNPFTEMDDVSGWVRKFPTFRQVALLVFRRVPGDPVIPHFRVSRPVISNQSFQPGAVNIGQSLGEIRVEINNIPAGSNDYFIAIL